MSKIFEILQNYENSRVSKFIMDIWIPIFLKQNRKPFFTSEKIQKNSKKTNSDPFHPIHMAIHPIIHKHKFTSNIIAYTCQKVICKLLTRKKLR